MHSVNWNNKVVVINNGDYPGNIAGISNDIIKQFNKSDFQQYIELCNMLIQKLQKFHTYFVDGELLSHKPWAYEAAIDIVEVISKQTEDILFYTFNQALIDFVEKKWHSTVKHALNVKNHLRNIQAICRSFEEHKSILNEYLQKAIHNRSGIFTSQEVYSLEGVYETTKDLLPEVQLCKEEIERLFAD